MLGRQPMRTGVFDSHRLWFEVQRVRRLFVGRLDPMPNGVRRVAALR